MWAFYSVFSLLFYSFNLIYVSIFIIICLNKNIILINKFMKHNWINVSSYKIKYLDLYLFLIIFFFLVIVYGFIYLLTNIVFNLFLYLKKYYCFYIKKNVWFSIIIIKTNKPHAQQKAIGKYLMDSININKQN
jgi:hypothetical protein